MKKIFLILIILLASVMGQATNYIVDQNTGSDSNDGLTTSTAFATMQKAWNTVSSPGDTIFLRGGTHHTIAPLDIDPTSGQGVNGSYNNPVVMMSYPGEWAIIDCSAHCENDVTPEWQDFYNNFLYITRAEYLEFRDFEFQNVFQCDSVIDGAITTNYSCNLTFRNIIGHDIGQRGIYYAGGCWNAADTIGLGTNQVPEFGFGHPDTTKFINVDLYNLADSLVSNLGNAADGYKTINYRNNYLSWESCRVWNYTDDGWDPTGGTGGIRIFNNCWAIPGDKYKAMDNGDVERNGFKCTGPINDSVKTIPWYSTDIHYVEWRNCIAYDCGTAGFIELDAGGGYIRNNALFYNNTAFRCGAGFSGNIDTQYPRTSIYRNNISFASTSPAGGTTYEVQLYYDNYTHSNNTWQWASGSWPNWEYNPNYTVGYDMFTDTTHANILAELTAPRNPDWSLPTITTLALSPTSDLIDGGIDVGLPYSGTAPDLGAIEFGESDLTAMFNYSPTNPETNQTITFDGSLSWPTDTTTITSWNWDFGDTTSGSGETTTHSYSSANTYTVTLTVTDSESNTDQYSANITISSPAVVGPTANFTVSANPTETDQTITFSDTSVQGDYEITGWSWNFGDSGTSTLQNPTHSYGSTGTYSVVLTVTDSQSNTDQHSVNVVVNEATGGSTAITAEEFLTLVSSVDGGGTLQLQTDTIIGDVIIDYNGTALSPIIITNASGIPPRFLDVVDITGNYININSVAFNDTLRLTGPLGFKLENCTINNSGLAIDIVPNLRDHRLLGWLFDNNTYPYLTTRFRIKNRTLDWSQMRIKYRTFEP